MATTYDNWMRQLREEDDDMAGPTEQAALVSYLKGTMTAAETASECQKNVPGPDSHAASLVWNLVIDAAAEFPRDQPQLLELMDIMAPVQTSKNASFAFELHEAYDGLESASLGGNSPSTKEQHFIHLCAFIARLWHHQQGEWAQWAMQLLHDGLEEDHGAALTNLYGKATAQLFLHSGAELYASSKDSESSMWSLGPLLVEEREKTQISRWDFWKQRVGHLKESGQLSGKTVALFSKVLEQMAEMEAK